MTPRFVNERSNVSVVKEVRAFGLATVPVDGRKSRNDEDVMTRSQLAEVLTVSESQIVIWVKENKIPYSRLCGSKLIRFPRKEIIEWLSSQTRAAELLGETEGPE